MDGPTIYALAEENPDMSDVERLMTIYWTLSHVLVSGVPGDVVELGCHAGLTSVHLQMLIDEFDPGRVLHVYDSFAGLPPAGPGDRHLRPGDLAVSAEALERNFRRRSLRPPVIHRGWFDDTLPRGLPDQVAFAYLDSDFYGSIRTSWVHLYPRLSSGAIVLVDDYCDPDRNPRAWAGLPAVKLACDAFLAGKAESMTAVPGCGDLAMGFLRRDAGPAGGRTA
ncbi:MAG TPA: TylF/MycF/NovP-related O-methyltransferase [Acidimicrobiia bacterium]|nr:TylF/MycF/NovP-related O-methyltransferase [Acidimicrobiia bacterium]